MVSQEQAEYLKANYQRFGNQKLAKALKRPKSLIHTVLKEMGCERTQEDMRYIHAHSKEQAPPFQGSVGKYRQPHLLGRKEKWWLSLSFFLPFVIYCSTTTSSPAGSSGVELALCAYGLAATKSISCPMYLLLGRILSLVYVGEFALWLNLLSAVCGAGVCFLLAHILYRLFRTVPASLFISLMLAFSTPLWQASVTTSPATLSFFFLALSLYYLLCWYEDCLEISLIFATISGIIAFTAHFLLFSFVPVFFLFLWVAKRKISLRLWGAILFLFFVLIHVFLYLPFLTFSSPTLESTNLKSVDPLLAYTLTPFLKWWQSLSLENTTTSLHELEKSLWPIFSTPFRFVFHALSLWALCNTIVYWYKEQRPLFYLFLMAILLCTALFLPCPLSSRATLVPLLFLMLCLLGKGVAKLYENTKTALVFSCACVFLLAAQFITHLPLSSYRTWDMPQKYAQEIRKNVQTNAVIIPWDDLTCMYLLYDSLIAHPNRPGYVCHFFGQDKDIAWLQKYPEQLLDALMQKYPGKPLYLTYIAPNWHLHRYYLVRKGIIWHAIQIIHGRPYQDKETETLPDWPSLTSYLSKGERDFLSQCHSINTIAYLERGETEKALRSLSHAPDYLGQLRILLLSHAQTLAAARNYPKAMQLYQMLTVQKPEAQLYMEMARIAKKQGNQEDSLGYYQKAIALSPHSFHALLELAQHYEREQKWADAARLYHKLIELYKEHPYPYRQLAKILIQKPESAEKAKELLQKAQELEKKSSSTKRSKVPMEVPQIHGLKQKDILHNKIPELGPKLPNLPKIPTPPTLAK